MLRMVLMLVLALFPALSAKPQSTQRFGQPLPDSAPRSWADAFKRVLDPRELRFNSVEPDSLEKCATTVETPDSLLILGGRGISLSIWTADQFGGFGRLGWRPVPSPSNTDSLRLRIVGVSCDYGASFNVILKRDQHYFRFGSHILPRADQLLYNSDYEDSAGVFVIIPHRPVSVAILRSPVRLEAATLYLDSVGRAQRLVQKEQEEERAARIATIRSKPWSAAIKRLVIAGKIQSGKIQLGMTPEQVQLAWGIPASVNRSVTRNGVREQWVYGLRTYVYFDDGRLSAWQAAR